MNLICPCDRRQLKKGCSSVRCCKNWLRRSGGGTRRGLACARPGTAVETVLDAGGAVPTRGRSERNRRFPLGAEAVSPPEGIKRNGSSPPARARGPCRGAGWALTQPRLGGRDGLDYGASDGRRQPRVRTQADEERLLLPPVGPVTRAASDPRGPAPLSRGGETGRRPPHQKQVRFIPRRGPGQDSGRAHRAEETTTKGRIGSVTKGKWQRTAKRT
ncbi:hypothetical protein NDU88_005909 [Pleurodeles waltl]|uniref:Uncharacterized protein n=1 Tax=Pleurodeles waltl TaxID=8319 RepID=A0AAV7LP72_PLEWA|nr:hypothetical protein NDU88_005909 [Pleurodeles waltl]